MLPDILAKDLKVIFCGTAAGTRSAAIGHYYAGRGNQFWPLLHELGLTPRRLTPDEDYLLPHFGIGLTDLAKDVAGMDRQIPPEAYAPTRLSEVIVDWAPRAIAFNGKKAAHLALGIRDRLPVGRYVPSPFENVSVWILPSTSGAARGHFDIGPWRDLADSL